MADGSSSALILLRSTFVYCYSDVDDLAAVCDRVLVLDRGVLTRELIQPLTPEPILDAIFTPAAGGMA